MAAWDRENTSQSVLVITHNLFDIIIPQVYHFINQIARFWRKDSIYWDIKITMNSFLQFKVIPGSRTRASVIHLIRSFSSIKWLMKMSDETFRSEFSLFSPWKVNIHSTMWKLRKTCHYRSDSGMFTSIMLRFQNSSCFTPDCRHDAEQFPPDHTIATSQPSRAISFIFSSKALSENSAL